jgi:hypothetical protein
LSRLTSLAVVDRLLDPKAGYPMKRVIAAFVVVSGLVACASETTGSGEDLGPISCTDITGNYSVTATRNGGTCPSPDKPTTTASITISKNGDALSIFLPGINGGCDGTLDTASCRFQAQCIVTSNGQTAITYNVDYTFHGTKFTGSLVGAAEAGVLDSKACTANAKHDGSRI